MNSIKDNYLNSLKSWVKYTPWEWVDNYRDEQGRYWFEIMGEWKLIRPETAYNTVTCLPYHINPN